MAVWLNGSNRGAPFGEWERESLERDTVGFSVHFLDVPIHFRNLGLFIQFGNSFGLLGRCWNAYVIYVQ